MTHITRTVGLTALLLMPALQAAAQEPPPAAPTEPPPAVAPPPAGAPAPSGGGEAFGAPGQFAVSVDLPFTNEAPQFAIYHESTSMGGASSTNISIMPSLDYFVAPNISVGGQLGVFHGGSYMGSSLPDGATATAYQIEVRGGYNVALNDAFSIWPHLGIGYVHASASLNGTSASGYTVPLVVTVPVLWHPANHFFLGLAPTFTTELVAKTEGNDVGKTTDIGLTAVLGGYFGGA